MYWKGLGVVRDRPIGYAWMDLAAERMYPNFTILRERYWSELDQAEQAAAIERGQALLALNRPAESRDAFRIADDFWRGYDADSHWSAEASYWLARALIETGDAATGKPMLKAARARLAKSPMPAHRRLAATVEAAR